MALLAAAVSLLSLAAAAQAAAPGAQFWSFAVYDDVKPTSAGATVKVGGPPWRPAVPPPCQPHTTLDVTAELWEGCSGSHPHHVLQIPP